MPVTPLTPEDRGISARVSVIATLGAVLLYVILSVVDMLDTRPRITFILFSVVVFFTLLLTSGFSGLIALVVRSGSFRLRGLVVACLITDLIFWFVLLG